MHKIPCVFTAKLKQSSMRTHRFQKAACVFDLTETDRSAARLRNRPSDRVWQWPDALSAICSPTYSGYMVEKTHVPKNGSKFIRAKFRTNFGYMSVYNHITTVCGWTNRAQSGWPLPYPAERKVERGGREGREEAALRLPCRHLGTG